MGENRAQSADALNNEGLLMTSKSFLRQLSFPAKLIALCVSAVVSTAVIMAIISFRHLSDQAINAGFQQLGAEATLNAELLEFPFHGLAQDATILASSPAIASLFQEMQRPPSPEQITKQANVTRQVSQVLAAFLNTRPHYDQVRVLTLENEGMEVVRVDRVDGLAQVRPNSELQAKGKEPYMVRLPMAEGPYYSKITLNREHGQVDGGGVPMIRLVHPLLDAQRQIVGAVVINGVIEDMVRGARPRMISGHSVTLLTGDGDHMLFDHANRTSPLVLRESDDWAPSAFHALLSGSSSEWDGEALGQFAAWGINAEGLAWHAARVRPLDRVQGLDLTVIAHMPKHALLAQSWTAVKGMILAMGVLAAISAALAWIAAKHLSAPITALLHAIQSRPDPLAPLDLGSQPNDEIGRLTDAFRELTNDLVARTNHATAIFESAADGVITVDRAGRILSTNPSLDTILGYPRGALHGQSLSVLLPEHVRPYHAAMLQGLELSGSGRRMAEDRPLQGLHRDGHLVELEASINQVENRGRDDVFVGIIRDVTVRRASEEALRERTESLQQTMGILEATFSAIEQGVLVLNVDLQILAWSSRFIDIMTPDKAILTKGLPMTEMLGHLYDKGDFGDDTGTRDEVVAETMERLGISGRNRKPRSYVRARANGRFVEVVSRLLPDGGVVITYTDVTQQEEARLEIERLAMSDNLTGLANRNSLRGRIQAGLRHTARTGERLAFMLIDLDKFKLVNDVFGHDAGDYVLTTVAERLQTRLGSQANVFRLGGDEFAVCVPFKHGANEIAELAETMIADLCVPMRFEDRPLEIGASIGIAIAPDDATRSEVLQRKADVALYQAKNGGRGRHHFYDAELDQQERRSRKVHSDLKRAVADGQLELFYQPKVEASSMRICGAEALLRWRHPEEGLLPPSEFVAAMERSDMVFEVGEWVIREGWNQLKAWMPLFDQPEFQLSVNVAARQFFEPSFLELLQDLKFQDPRLVANFDLELTEEVMIDNMDRAVEVMRKIEDQGFSVSLDDFGTGYSSISYLHRLPVRVLKIDKSFLEPLGNEQAAAAIVKTIINLGRNLGVTVTAEGVETQEQVDFLKSHGCTYLQGYYFSKPVPAKDFEAMIEIQAQRADLRVLSR